MILKPNKSKVDWPFQPLYTLNPIIGCKRNCYNGNCWARKLNNRFNFVENFDKLNFIGALPENIPGKDKYIWIGSMTDICFWDDSFLDSVLDIVSTYTTHKIIFLTKNPKVYIRHEFPQNSMIGLTINCKDPVEVQQAKRDILIKGSKYTNGNFLSIEPLLDFPAIEPEDNIDLYIVGALSNAQYEFNYDWIEWLYMQVDEDKIYFKNNIKKYLKSNS